MTQLFSIQKQALVSRSQSKMANPHNTFKVGKKQTQYRELMLIASLHSKWNQVLDVFSHNGKKKQEETVFAC